MAPTKVNVALCREETRKPWVGVGDGFPGGGDTQSQESKPCRGFLKLQQQIPVWFGKTDLESLLGSQELIKYIPPFPSSFFQSYSRMT